MVTSATGGFLAAHVGNGIAIAGSIYEILTLNSSTSISVSRDYNNAYPASATGQTGKIGGALGSPGFFALHATDGHVGHCKAGTYLVTSTNQNVAAGRPYLSSGVRVYGYTTTRLDYGATRPVIRASGVSSTTLAGVNNGTDSSTAVRPSSAVTTSPASSSDA